MALTESAAMRIICVSITIMMLLSGCEQFEQFSTVQVDNPVMGPPPPRTAMPDDRIGGEAYADTSDEQSGNRPASGGIFPVNFLNNESTNEQGFDENQVIATVNGSPIFAADILGNYAKQFEQFKSKMSPREVREMQEMLIKRDLGGHIENRLLVTSLRRTLEKEQLERMEQHLQEQFEKLVDDRKKHLNVATKQELDLKLQNDFGTSLANLQTSFNNRNMAAAYLNEKARIQEDKALGRPELWAYYEEHLADYDFPARVNWQQIVVSFRKHGGKEKAFEVFSQAVDELKQTNGANFSEVAQKYSDGPKANQAGRWGWTRQGSLADKEVEKTLFELPIGKISLPIVDKASFRLVKILKRESAGRTPFAKVQEEIKETLERDLKKQAAEQVIADLKKDAVIETIFGHEENQEAELPFR